MAGFFAKLFKNDQKIDDDFYEEVEETLYMGDMGAVATEELVENLKERTGLDVLNVEVGAIDDGFALDVGAGLHGGGKLAVTGFLLIAGGEY